MQVKEVGRVSKGVFSWDNNSLFDKRKDFLGFRFQAVTLPAPPVMTVTTIEDEIRLGGMIGEIWHGIFDQTMNFFTNIILSPDGNWGSRDKNGTWNGMIKELYEN